jgi:hypothetical protein
MEDEDLSAWLAQSLQVQIPFPLKRCPLDIPLISEPGHNQMLVGSVVAKGAVHCLAKAWLKVDLIIS